MIKLLSFLLSVFIFAAVVGWLARNPGNLTVVWLNHEIHASFAVALSVAAVVAFCAFFSWRILRILLLSPQRLSSVRKSKRSSKGNLLLTQSAFALAEGNLKTARKLSARARKLLHNPSLALMIQAQASQPLRPDEALNVHRDMLKQPQTQVHGLHGLHQHSLANKQIPDALQYAQTAVAHEPPPPWALHGAVQLLAAQLQWDKALDVIKRGRKTSVLPKALADELESVLLLAQALQALGKLPENPLAPKNNSSKNNKTINADKNNDKNNDDEDNNKSTSSDSPADNPLNNARTLAQRAQQLHHTPQGAAILAHCLIALEQPENAMRILLEAWSRSPDPALIPPLNSLSDDPKQRLLNVKRLTARHPSHIESRLALADAACRAEQPELATETLKPLLDKAPSARVCFLMAQVPGTTIEQQRSWLARAVNAPQDPLWISSAGRVHDQWLPFCALTGAFNDVKRRPPQGAPQKTSQRFLAPPQPNP